MKRAARAGDEKPVVGFLLVALPFVLVPEERIRFGFRRWRNFKLTCRQWS